MNRRVCVWIGSVLGCAATWQLAGVVGVAPARAQVPPSTPSSPSGPTAAALTAQATAAAASLLPLQNSPAITPGQKSGLIAPFIAKQLTALATPDPTGQGTVAVARQALMLGCPRLGSVPGTSSAAYATAYSAALSQEAIKVLSVPTTATPVKINIGIVVEHVASNGQSTQLIAAVEKLLADRADPVVYWGCKSARPLIVAIVLQQNFNGKSPLFRAIVTAVGQHPTGDLAGLIATEAYRALVVNPNNVPGMPAVQVKPLLKPLYEPVLDLLELRTGMYAKGVVPSPDAEENVPTFLTTSAPPPIYTDAQKKRAVQDLVNLLDTAGQRAAGVTNTAEVRQLRDSLQNAASALNVFSGTNLLSKVSLMPMGVTGPNMAALTATVYPAMSGPFPYLQRPVTLPPLPATPADGATPAMPTK